MEFIITLNGKVFCLKINVILAGYLSFLIADHHKLHRKYLKERI